MARTISVWLFWFLLRSHIHKWNSILSSDATHSAVIKNNWHNFKRLQNNCDNFFFFSFLIFVDVAFVCATLLNSLEHKRQLILHINKTRALSHTHARATSIRNRLRETSRMLVHRQQSSLFLCWWFCFVVSIWFFCHCVAKRFQIEMFMNDK